MKLPWRKPKNAIATIPYPLSIIFAMLIGAGLGLIMGLTTSRMRGTAFAFIALAISMFIFNFFHDTPELSGGETGLTIPTPDLIQTGPFYLVFVAIAFVVLAAFIGSVVLYIRKRTDYTGLILVTPVLVAITVLTVFLGTNIIGSVLVFIAFLVMILLHWIEKNRSTSDPLQYSEYLTLSGPAKSTNPLVTYVMPFIIIVVGLIGLFLSFATNIDEMVMLWIEDSSTFYFTIPVQYYLVLSCLVLVYVFVRRLIASPFGRMITAVAQNEERAEALGYNSYHAKIVVLVISGAIASLAGALFAPRLIALLWSNLESEAAALLVDLLRILIVTPIPMALAALCPIAMLFVRCGGGISHNPLESISGEDAEVAAQVFLDFLENLDPASLAS